MAISVGAGVNKHLTLHAADGAGREAWGGARQVGVGHVVVVGVDEDETGPLDDLLFQAGAGGPDDPLVGREAHVAVDLQDLVRAPTYGCEAELAVDCDGSEEPATVVVLADDAHTGDR